MTDSENPKDCLYLVLYVRDGVNTHQKNEDRYHWALLAVRSNSTQATRFHARDYFTSADQTHWIYEEIHVSARGTPKLLAQTYVGNIINNERLFEILRDVPIRQEGDWNCVRWVEEAMTMVWKDDVVEGGGLGMKELKKDVLRAADMEVARRENMVRAVL